MPIWGARSRLFNCSKCRYPVQYGDVYNTVRIPEQPTHMALLYRCSNCGDGGRTAVSFGEWEALTHRAEESDRTRYLLIREFQIDMEVVETPADLELYWRATPPFIEAKAADCGCSDCIRRYYNEKNN